MSIPIREDEITPKQLRNIELSGGFRSNVGLHLTRICLYHHFYSERTIALRGGARAPWFWGLRSYMNGIFL